MSKFNAGAINTINPDTVESDGTQYPAISFHNGDPAQKKAGGVSYEGGWFISEDGAPADMTDYGWTKDSFVNRNGEEITGYWSSTINVSSMLDSASSSGLDERGCSMPADMPLSVV